MDVPIEANKRFHTSAPVAEVFAVLSDVPRSVGHYPDVETLQRLEDGVYRWDLQELGAAGISHRIFYACRYVLDAEAGTVSWTPVEGVGNGRISGRWQLTADAAGTWIDFHNTGTLSVPIPRLLKSVGVPYVQAAFSAQIETYLANLVQTFEGG